MSIKLYKGDCINIMNTLINDNVKVDAIITDPPYGTTSCAWDSIIPFIDMWSCLHKIIKNAGAIVLFGTEPFSSLLRTSNLEEYRYEWYWYKSKPGNFLNVKLAPLKKIENILVFSNGGCSTGSNNMPYYPQGIVKYNQVRINHKSKFNDNGTLQTSPSRAEGTSYIQEFTNYPHNVLTYANEQHTIYPTQKPINLLEYLIKTYTKKGETILDFTMGSGSTGVACKKLNRNFIGIEKEEKYFDIAQERINNTLKKSTLL